MPFKLGTVVRLIDKGVIGVYGVIIAASNDMMIPAAAVGYI